MCGVPTPADDLENAHLDVIPLAECMFSRPLCQSSLALLMWGRFPVPLPHRCPRRGSGGPSRYLVPARSYDPWPSLCLGDTRLTAFGTLGSLSSTSRIASSGMPRWPAMSNDANHFKVSDTISISCCSVRDRPPSEELAWRHYLGRGRIALMFTCLGLFMKRCDLLKSKDLGRKANRSPHYDVGM